jgi:hypothetical protein
MGPKELCKRGIATHVIVSGKEITAKQYLKLLKQERRKEKDRSLEQEVEKALNKKSKKKKKK